MQVMLKATGGGGGMGLQVCNNKDEISAAFKKVKSRGETLFNNTGVFLEKYYQQSRHIEVQIFGNGTDIVHFGERECSIQRRHQKVLVSPQFHESELKDYRSLKNVPALSSKRMPGYEKNSPNALSPMPCD
jgi:biotin carboxylase